MKIAFIGLGTMGSPMANCLKEAGFSVVGWDAVDSACSRFEYSSSSLGDALSQASVLITMLPSGDDVQVVHSDPAMAGLAENALLIDCSTIDVEASKALATEAEAKGFQMLDAPVSGGPEGAAAGTLAFMVGGEETALERANPLFDCMGSKLTYFGDAGTGQAAKACHNLICGITGLAVCEAFALADALDLDHDKFFNLCKNAAAQSWILENRCPVPGPAPKAPASNDYAPGFAARLLAKDLGIARDAAAAVGQDIPIGQETARRYAEFAEGEGGNLDFSAIYRTIRQA